jgi:hypothetical protein
MCVRAWEECLATLGDSADDIVKFDVVGVVGLDVGGEAVEGALDGFFGGGVHHAWLYNFGQWDGVVRDGEGENVRIEARHRGTMR